ncbi:hypothetical protein JTM19_37820, partial [Pseudomonas aeruginosa]|nr:hypothetical protein [Pseudomonas aeruginosa]
LLNTCSIREKAQEKVFHQLGRWKLLKEKNPDLIIGVGGCVASQEGDHIRQRALDRQRVHTYRNFAGLQGGGDFPLIAALRSDHFPQHRIQIRQLHRHLLPGAQI